MIQMEFQYQSNKFQQIKDKILNFSHYHLNMEKEFITTPYSLQTWSSK